MRHDHTLPTLSYIRPDSFEQREMLWLRFTATALVADRQVLQQRLATAPTEADWLAVAKMDVDLADYEAMWAHDQQAAQHDYRDGQFDC